MARTAIVYVDGFNFYHGAVRDHPELKWLDLEVLSESLLRGCKVVRVNYYTAVVKDLPTDPSQSQRQNDYLRLLGAQPRTEVILGQFQKKKANVAATAGWPVDLEDGSTGTLVGGQRVRGRAWEEKGSDVNLGTDLSWDACSAQMQVALVLSNDLDLQRPVTRAVSAGIEVIVVNPHHRTNERPSLVGSGTRKLKRNDLLKAQFPDEVVLADGTRLRRPATW